MLSKLVDDDSIFFVGKQQLKAIYQLDHNGGLLVQTSLLGVSYQRGMAEIQAIKINHFRIV